jgi:hypothetical protein
MRLSNYYAQNQYGSFGYATGANALGDTCIYAWQRIRAPDLDNTMISHQGTVAIRLRYCEPAATDAQLLSIMTGFTINSYFLARGWNPYGSPPPPPPNVGVVGANVLPTDKATYIPAEAPPPVAPVRVRRARVAAPEVPMAVIADPAVDPTAVIVPLPPGGAEAPAGNFQNYPTVPPP